MYSLVTIMPYYGGRFDGHSDPGYRIDYLRSTVASLTGISNRIIVAVQNSADQDALSSLNIPAEILFIKIDNPLHLPAALCEFVQNAGYKEDFIYYTEADQPLFCEDPGSILGMLKNKDLYFAPHRLSKVPEQLTRFEFIIGSDLRKAYLKQIDGIFYAIENKSDANRQDLDGKFYINKDIMDAYGGAFLCRYDFFKEIRFSYSEKYPTEHTAGFDLFNKEGACCLKTRDVLDFYVDHLSGIEFYKNHLVLKEG